MIAATLGENSELLEVPQLTILPTLWVAEQT